MDVYWWLSALTEYVYCPACWIILPHPWGMGHGAPMGQLIKTQFFGKQHFKGFCEKILFLILPRISSQKIKDSQPRLKNSSIFMVSPPRSQEKGWLTLPHFPLYISSATPFHHIYIRSYDANVTTSMWELFFWIMRISYSKQEYLPPTIPNI